MSERRRLGNVDALDRVSRFDDPTQSMKELLLARTEVAEILLVLDGAGRPRHAVDRRCPHKRRNLDLHAKPGPCPRAIACRHGGYLWDLETGAFIGDQSDGTPLQLTPVEIDVDGVIWMTT